MGRKSIKKDKNVYQLAREEAGLTRAQASEAMRFVSESRIEKIEAGRSIAQPDEAAAMAEAYKKPALRNFYCSHECPIGKMDVPPVKSGSLAEIVLEVLAGINSVSRMKDDLIRITADGQVDDSEIPDFVRIQSELEYLSQSVDALKLWVDEKISSGAIDEKVLEEFRSKL